MKRKLQKNGEKMKIYVLEEYNTGRTACISEDINMIRKQMCNKDFFDPEYNDYPILKIWENGVETERGKEWKHFWQSQTGSERSGDFGDYLYDFYPEMLQ